MGTLQFRAGFVCLVAALSLTAQPKAVVRGIVKDQIGAVVEAATVQLFSEPLVVETKTDAEGKFEFRDLTPGTYELEVERPGFRRARVDSVPVADINQKPLSIVLEIANSHEDCGQQPHASYEKAVDDSSGVTGLVRSADSEQSALAALLYVNEAGDNRVIAESSANAKGEFGFAKLKPGRYVIRARLKGYNEALTQVFRVTQNNVTRLRIFLLREGWLIVC